MPPSNQLLLAAICFFHISVTVFAACVHNGTVLQEHETLSLLRSHCTGISSYLTLKLVCEKGKIVTTSATGDCGKTVPYCFDCSKQNTTQSAYCYDKPEPRVQCSKYFESQTQESHRTCPFGDRLFNDGDTIETRLEHCVSGKGFNGTVVKCREGKVIQEPYLGNCSENCVQCARFSEGGVGAFCAEEHVSSETCLHFPSQRTCSHNGKVLFSGERVTTSKYSCVGKSRFTALEVVCRSGLVKEELVTGTCSEEKPYCVQCNEPGTPGGAVCLASPDQPPACSWDTRCFSEGKTYNNGEVVQESKNYCVGTMNYTGSRKICRNGNVRVEDFTRNCGSGSPYCIDCATAGQNNSVMCLTSQQAHSFCDSRQNHSRVGARAGYGTKNCEVNNKIYEDGDIIAKSGLQCDSPFWIGGRQTVCRNGKVVDEKFNDQCGPDMPYCIQCGDHNQSIAAACMTERTAKLLPCVPLVEWQFPTSGNMRHKAMAVQAPNINAELYPNCLDSNNRIHNNGSVVSEFAMRCLNSRTFAGMQNICLNGQILRKEATNSCRAPQICVQCERPGRWVTSATAFCQENATVPAMCPLAKGRPCWIDGVMHSHDDLLSSTSACINQTHHITVQLRCWNSIVTKEEIMLDCHPSESCKASAKNGNGRCQPDNENDGKSTKQPVLLLFLVIFACFDIL